MNPLTELIIEFLLTNIIPLNANWNEKYTLKELTYLMLEINIEEGRGKKSFREDTKGP